MAESGWYDDPENPNQLRWWDGDTWTENTRPNIKPSSMPPPTSRPVAGDPPEPEDPTTPQSLPPWAISDDSEENDFDFDEFEDEFDDELGDEFNDGPGEAPKERPPSLFEATQQAFRDGPDPENVREVNGEEENDEKSGPQRPPRSGPPIMERSPESGSVGGPSPQPPWLDSQSERRPDTPREKERSTPLPPWLRNEPDRGSTIRENSGRGDGSSERPRPPWLRDSPPSERNTSSTRPRYSDDFDDEDFMDRRRPTQRPEQPEPAQRLASWEEMMEDFDENEPGKFNVDPNKVKRFVLLGAGIAVGILLFYMIFQIVGGGNSEESETEEETTVELITLGEWSQWPDARGGYVIRFPEPPTYTAGNDRSVWTSRVTLNSEEVEKGEEEPRNATYRAAQKFIDPAYIAAAPPQERTNLASQFLAELYPEYTISEFETVTLGGIPGRKTTLTTEGKPSITAIFTLTESTLFVLTANEEADSTKFFDSFQWFRQPELPPVSGR